METQVLEYYSPTSLSAKFYEVLTSLDPSIAGDAAFYARYCPVDGRTLELGSGSGRLSFGLAASQINIVGIENSVVMLEKALARLKTAPSDLSQRIEFVRGDATTVRVQGAFQLSIAPFYLFNHIHTTRQRAAILKTMSDHLVAGGHAILHLLPTGRVSDSNAAGPNSGMKIHFKEPNEFLEITWRRRRVDRNTRSMEQLVEYRHLDGDRKVIQETLERFTMSWLSDSQLEAMARRVELTLVEVRTSFCDTPGGERIYIFRKS